MSQLPLASVPQCLQYLHQNWQVEQSIFGFFFHLLPCGGGVFVSKKRDERTGELFFLFQCRITHNTPLGCIFQQDRFCHPPDAKAGQPLGIFPAPEEHFQKEQNVLPSAWLKALHQTKNSYLGFLDAWKNRNRSFLQGPDDTIASNRISNIMFSAFDNFDFKVAIRAWSLFRA